MANNPISMSKVRQILKLHTQGIGKKRIASRLGMSKNTVKAYLDCYHGLKTTWEELLQTYPITSSTRPSIRPMGPCRTRRSGRFMITSPRWRSNSASAG
jgi:hypothetical protein